MVKQTQGLPQGPGKPSEFIASIKDKTLKGSRQQDAAQRRAVLAEVEHALLVEHNHNKPAARALEPSLDALEAWLKDNGAKMDGVRLAPAQDATMGNGVLCTKAFIVGELAFSVPRKLMISVEDIAEATTESVLTTMARKDSLCRGQPMILLACKLVQERAKGADSFFKPYIDILPTAFPTLPIMWPHDDLALLQGVQAGEVALQRRFNIVSYYCHMQPHLPDMTFADFRWAMAVVMTRQNPLPVKANNNLTGYALIPLFDMCNFSPGQLSSEYHPKSDALRCMAMQAFAAGQEFRIFYGPRTNTSHLCYSGFVPALNPHNTCDDLIEMQDDDLIPVKVMVAEKAKLNGRIPIVADPASKAMQTCRIAVATKDEVADLLRAQHASPQDPSIKHISPDNEQRARAWLAHVAQNLLQKRKALLANLDDMSSSSSSSKEGPNHALAVALIQSEVDALSTIAKA